MHHHTVGCGAIGSGSIPQNIALGSSLHNHAGNVPNLGASAYLTAAEAQPKPVPATTALVALHDTVATAVRRAYGVRDEAEAFAQRVGVSLPPADGPVGERVSPNSVTHAIHVDADELHRILSAIEDILGALRQHA